MPKNSVYAERFNNAILRMQQSGLIDKLFRELQWAIQKQRGGGGGGALLKASASKQLKSTDAEDRGLTLADTEGMFLLMGIGYLIGASALMSEVIGGCANRCRKIARRVSVVSLAGGGGERLSPPPNSSRRTSYSMRPSLVVPENGCDTLQVVSERCSASPRIRRRRQSDQTEVLRVNLLKGILNGHRRHNSLVTGLNREEIQCVLDVGRRGAVKFADGVVDEREQSSTPGSVADGVPSRIYHVAEINRVPTPFIIQNDGFGEPVYD